MPIDSVIDLIGEGTHLALFGAFLFAGVTMTIFLIIVTLTLLNAVVFGLIGIHHRWVMRRRKRMAYRNFREVA